MAMHRAGFDLDGAVAMLSRLRAEGEESNRLMNGWFGSHPLTGNRIERVKEMIADLRRQGRIQDRESDFQELHDGHDHDHGYQDHDARAERQARKARKERKNQRR
jgi:predicted Zn-dependent protease